MPVSFSVCAFAGLVTLCGCSPKTVVSSSMSPTIKAGTKVAVDWTAYATRAPKRWDVVCFEPPMSSNQFWVMRVVGLPGDCISFSTGAITLNGQSLMPPPYVSNVHYVSLERMEFRNPSSNSSPCTVPTNCVFVLGDNSTNAFDSRFWGVLPRTNIFGRIRGI